MAAEATRERILAAALAEFSAYGIAGARVDRIAEVAGCNKNLIYVYFEDKETLFATVLKLHLARIYEATAFTPADLPAYAIRILDFAMANPVVMRLFAWSGLENSAGTAAARRAEIDRKVTAMTKAEKAANVSYLFSPPFRLTAIITLATAWSSANPFGGILDPDAEGNAGALRESIAQAVRLISSAPAQHKPARRRRARSKHHKARG